MYRNWATDRNSTDRAIAELYVISYCDELSEVCSSLAADHMHICTAMCGLGEVWAAAVSQHAAAVAMDSDLWQLVQLLATTLCCRLSDVMQHVQARDAAVALKACSDLKLQPYSCQPGLSEALNSAIMRDTACSQSLTKHCGPAPALAWTPVEASYCHTSSARCLVHTKFRLKCCPELYSRPEAFLQAVFQSQRLTTSAATSSFTSRVTPQTVTASPPGS